MFLFYKDPFDSFMRNKLESGKAGFKEIGERAVLEIREDGGLE